MTSLSVPHMGTVVTVGTMVVARHQCDSYLRSPELMISSGGQVIFGMRLLPAHLGCVSDKIQVLVHIAGTKTYTHIFWLGYRRCKANTPSIKYAFKLNCCYQVENAILRLS